MDIFFYSPIILNCKICLKKLIQNIRSVKKTEQDIVTQDEIQVKPGMNERIRRLREESVSTPTLSIERHL